MVRTNAFGFGKGPKSLLVMSTFHVPEKFGFLKSCACEFVIMTIINMIVRLMLLIMVTSVWVGILMRTSQCTVFGDRLSTPKMSPISRTANRVPA